MYVQHNVLCIAKSFEKVIDLSKETALIKTEKKMVKIVALSLQFDSFNTYYK